MAQFDALAKRHNESERRSYYRAGLICTMIGNAPFKKRNFKPDDFVPGGKPNGKGSSVTLDDIRRIHKASGGKDIFKPEPQPDLSQEELKAIVAKIKREALDG